MKKYFLTLLLTLLTCVSAMAGSDIKVIQGDKKFIKYCSGTASFMINWDDATYDYKMPLQHHFNNMQELNALALNAFCTEFNDINSKLKAAPYAQNPDIIFDLKVTNMDQYVKVMSWVPGMATKVWGTLTVVDAASNTIIAVIDVNEVNGGANLSPDGTIEDCFEDLAKQVSRLK